MEKGRKKKKGKRRKRNIILKLFENGIITMDDAIVLFLSDTITQNQSSPLINAMLVKRQKNSK